MSHGFQFVGHTLNRAIGVLGLALFFLMLFVPHTYRPVKAGLLALLLAGISCSIFCKEKTIRLHPHIAVWSLVLSTTCTFFIVRGLLNDAPGATDIRSVYALAPVLFATLIASISTKGLHMIMATLVAAAVALGLYGAMYIAHAKGYWPDELYLALNQGQAIGFYDGFVEYQMYSISTLVALVPILAVALVEWRKGISPVPRAWLWLGYVTCFGLVILSGRRALWLVLFCLPFVYAFLLAFQPRPIEWPRMRGRLLIIMQLLIYSAVVFVVLAATFGLNLNKMLTYAHASIPQASSPVASGPVASGPDASALLRNQQAVALWQGWLEEPWLGHGHGAVAAVIRNEQRPWQYELSYLALLFHTGIVGTLIFAASIGWVYWQGLRIIRQSSLYGPYMMAALAGTSGALIAHATNPYLNTFDCMWMIFLPLAIINRYLLERDQVRSDAV